jgi:hypothetical protein
MSDLTDKMLHKAVTDYLPDIKFLLDKGDNLSMCQACILWEINIKPILKVVEIFKES